MSSTDGVLQRIFCALGLHDYWTDRAMVRSVRRCHHCTKVIGDEAALIAERERVRALPADATRGEFLIAAFYESEG